MSMQEDQNLPLEPVKPEPTTPLPPRRRRVTRRSHIPTDAAGQAELIASLARRAYPSIELFVFSLVCGAILGLGYLLDSQAVILFGILVAPLMTPWVGFLLAMLTGSLRFMFETLMALLISLIFVFVGGLLTGFAARLLMPITLNNIYIHSRLWIPELVVFVIGAITLVISFARSEDKPFLPSVLIAYAFFLPISASAFGLSAGLPNVWLQGLLVFLTHFALTSTIGLVTLLILRLRPTTGGIMLSVIMILAFAAILITLIGSGSPTTQTDVPQATPTNANQETPLSPTEDLSGKPEPSATPLVQAATNTPTANNITPSPVPVTLEITLPPTQTPTITLTIPPEPVYGKVRANEGGGANLRDAPGGTYVMTLLNGTIVETYSEFQLVNGTTWVKVFAQVNGQRIEGWLLESVISYATPAPDFQPSSTPQGTPTIIVTP
ncbi:MAG: DUF389 domain-containing protein [Anaerolineales bacterium]|nr:DUF389 domain-containing protein [Anaerolineales bacterium]MCB9146908.1 DUF389 domain-containing protein [Anaerolineales bacterium]